MDTSLLKNVVHIIGDETIAGPLGEETKRDKDDKSAAVARSLEELGPATTFKFFLESDRFADLFVFDLHKLGFNVPSGMSLGKDFQSLFILALGNKKAWRFRYKPFDC